MRYCVEVELIRVVSFAVTSHLAREFMAKKKATTVLVESTVSEAVTEEVAVSKKSEKKSKEKGEILFDITFSPAQFEEFSLKLAFAARLIPSRPTHPVLWNVKLQADKDGTICLTAYDMDLGADIFQECNIITGGSVLIPGKLLTDMLSRIPTGDLRITATSVPDSDKAEIVIKSGTVKYSISGLNAKDLEGYNQFPVIPSENDTGTKLKLPADVLAKGINATFFTSCADEAKQVLTGIKLKTGEAGCEFVSTDGYRLSRFASQVEGVAEAEVEVVLPRKFLSKVKELIDLEQEFFSNVQVHLTIEDDRLFCATDSCYLTARRLVGVYPDVDRLIPQGFTVTATLDTRQLFAGVCIASVYAAQATNDAMKVSVSVDGLTLQATAQNIGDALEHVKCYGVFVKEPFVFGMNYKYFQSAVKNMPTSEMTINANAPTQPVVLKSVSDGGVDEFLCLLMPIQFRE